ncbi:MAG TPA: response regulator transcription factor [Pseudidiomarina sp.]|nr:response regulator transcription factor [Pseudidiomarina sp.]
MNVLIVEDEQRLAQFLLKGLTAEGYRCDHASDGRVGLQLAVAGDYDVIILDRMLPQKDGLAVLHELRQRGIVTRVLMLTALNETDDKILGLRAGADDYLGKPFDFDELVARIEALGRRTAPSVTQTLQCGAITLDADKHLAFLDDALLELTSKEFDLLKFFLKHPNTALSRERILNKVWGTHEDPLTNIVDVYIRRLRLKLNDVDNTLIETVRGVGYRLVHRTP